MMNRQIRVEKIIGIVKCVTTCGAIEIQPVETWNSSAKFSFLLPRCRSLRSVITGRIPRSGILPVLNLLTGQKSGFSPSSGDSLHRFRSNFAGPTGTWVRFAVQNFTSIATWGGNAAPKISKKFHSLVKSRPVGVTPLTDF